jgi:hypothetical protein
MNKAAKLTKTKTEKPSVWEVISELLYSISLMLN